MSDGGISSIPNSPNTDAMRTANCACNRLQIKIDGDPSQVIRCHCDYCQRRTGSVFQVSGWFTEDQVTEIVGESNVYNGLRIDGLPPSAPGAEDGGINYHFCPTCGSTVYWTFDLLPGLYGMAVGSFVDAKFPPPRSSSTLPSVTRG
jgi:hypothetical protein